jgi:hypothetical protein
VVVEATLPDRDRTRSQQLAELRKISSCLKARRIVGMNTGRSEDEAGVLCCVARRSGGRGERFTDTYYRDRARIAGAGNYLVAVAGERRVREVGVAVDEDRRVSVLRGQLRSIQRRTGAAT